MGDLYRALGQGEKAREAYLKDLAIAEMLANAEPDRADYQRDLVISLVRIAPISGDRAKEVLHQALDILESLQATGRLDPVDEPMIAAVQQLIAEAETGQG